MCIYIYKINISIHIYYNNMQYNTNIHNKCECLSPYHPSVKKLLQGIQFWMLEMMWCKDGEWMLSDFILSFVFEYPRRCCIFTYFLNQRNNNKVRHRLLVSFCDEIANNKLSERQHHKTHCNTIRLNTKKNPHVEQLNVSQGCPTLPNNKTTATTHLSRSEPTNGTYTNPCACDLST